MVEIQTWPAYLGMHNVEISGFFYHSDLLWNQFWSSFWFLKPKSLPFWPYFQLWIFDIFIFQLWNFSRNHKSKPSKVLKWQFLTFWNQPKLISRNTRVARKSLNFHIVVSPQSKCSIRLSRSVILCKTILRVSILQCQQKRYTKYMWQEWKRQRNQQIGPRKITSRHHSKVNLGDRSLMH